MATAKPKRQRPADPKARLTTTIEHAKGVFAKHKAKPLNDPKRRLALKKLKRGQRGLAKIQTAEKRIAAAKAKGAKSAEA